MHPHVEPNGLAAILDAAHMIAEAFLPKQSHRANPPFWRPRDALAASFIWDHGTEVVDGLMNTRKKHRGCSHHVVNAAPPAARGGRRDVSAGWFVIS